MAEIHKLKQIHKTNQELQVLQSFIKKWKHENNFFFKYLFLRFVY